MPPCRFNFFVILVFTIIEGTKGIVRRVLRRGKALVTKAYVAWTNEQNEHGAFVPERTHPFRSSSSDVHQSIFRSNGDLQFKDRAVPVQALDGSCGALEPTASEGRQSTLFFGPRSLSSQCRAVLFSYEVALKASSVTDFYMTKLSIQNAASALCSIGTDHCRNEAFRGRGKHQENRKSVYS